MYDNYHTHIHTLSYVYISLFLHDKIEIFVPFFMLLYILYIFTFLIIENKDIFKRIKCTDYYSML